MNISNEKKQVISKFVNENFLAFVKSKGLTESKGKVMGPETYVKKLTLAEEFAENCILSIRYSSDEELMEIKAYQKKLVDQGIAEILYNYSF